MLPDTRVIEIDGCGFIVRVQSLRTIETLTIEALGRNTKRGRLPDVSTSSPRPPGPVLWAAIIAAIQSLIGLGYAALLIVREASGYTDPSIVYESDNANTAVGYGTAVFFIIIFGAVLTGAIFMARAKKWGRGPVIMLEILLLLISYYMFSAGQTLMGLATALSAVIALGMLFSPRAVHWAATHY